MNVLILSGSNHGFAASAPVIHEFLSVHDDLSVALDDDKDVLASDGLRDFDVLVHGTGFTRGERQEDGTVQQVPVLTPAQEEGLFDFVAGGKGLGRHSRHCVVYWRQSCGPDWRSRQLAPAGIDLHRRHCRQRSPRYTGRARL